MSWGLGGLQPPELGKIFFRTIEQFFGQRPKMKNNILKIINEKYKKKYSIGYSKIECSKSKHFGVRHSDWKSCLIKLVLEFIFRALPHIFRAKSIQPPSFWYRLTRVVLDNGPLNGVCVCVCVCVCVQVTMKLRSSSRFYQASLDYTNDDTHIYSFLHLSICLSQRVPSLRY